MASGGNSIWRVLFKLFDNFIEARDQYNKIKANEESKKVSTLLGKKSITNSIIALVLFAGGIALTLWGWSIMQNQSLAGVFGIILLIIGIVLLIYPILFMIISLNYLIKQLCLNKRAVGWIALAIFVLVIVLAGVGTYFGIQMVG